jgi:hypothetical protein
MMNKTTNKVVAMVNRLDSEPTLDNKKDAELLIDKILTRKQELEDYVAVVQPLLYEASLRLYGDDDTEVSLYDLIQDTIKLIRSTDNNPKQLTLIN